jgi:hypothetical protein
MGLGDNTENQASSVNLLNEESDSDDREDSKNGDDDVNSSNRPFDSVLLESRNNVSINLQSRRSRLSERSPVRLVRTTDD